jgi:beta-galactosidase
MSADAIHDAATDNSMKKFLCGVNYWPRKTGVHMWKEWDAESIDAEFRQMAELSLNACRVFLLWEDFQPDPYRVSEEAMAKFDELVKISKAHGVGLIPTFFTGHMSGENWDVPWRSGRDPYEDPFMLRAQTRLVREFASRYKDEDAILLWDLSNEPDIFAKPQSVDAAWLWTHLLYRELKAYDPERQVTLGIHATSLFWPGPFRIGDVSEVNDILCMHPYPLYTELCPEPLDSLRSTYFVPFACRFTEGMGGKRVLLEEFGSTTQMASPEVEARFHSAALYSALANGVIGALAWCFGDFVKQTRLPYESTPYEIGFGITAKDGKVKEKGLVLSEFARTVRDARIHEFLPARADAAIVIPRKYYDNLDPENTPTRNAATLFASFILAKSAGLDVDFITCDMLATDDISRYKALFVPCATRRGALNISDFTLLREFVESGGTLYCSYDGVAVDGMEEVFGISILHASVPQGSEWTVKVPGLEAPLRGPLPAPPGLARRKHLNFSIAAQGTPGCREVIVNRYGKGNAIFIGFPLELCLATTPHILDEDAYYEIYSLVARTAGLDVEWKGSNPAIEVRRFTAPGRDVFVVVNHEPKEQVVNIGVPANTGDGLARSWRHEAGIEIKDGKISFVLGPSEGDLIEILN